MSSLAASSTQHLASSPPPSNIWSPICIGSAHSRGGCSDGAAMTRVARLQMLAGKVHSLGPSPLYEMLRELNAGADLHETIERYARLAPLAEFIATHGGRQATSPAHRRWSATMSLAYTIARALQGNATASGSYLVRCLVPSHGNGRGDRNPSLMIRDGDKPGRVLVHCYAGGLPADVLTALRQRGLLADAGDEDRRRHTLSQPAPPPKHEPDSAALATWRKGVAITAEHTAGRYLAARGLTIEPPPSLRASMLEYLDMFSLPAMIAAVQAPDRRVIAVQTTLIDPRGDRKAQVRMPRKTIGSLGLGAVRLAAAHDVLGLTEGTEKALAAMQLFQTLAGRRWAPAACTGSSCPTQCASSTSSPTMTMPAGRQQSAPPMNTATAA
jgi:putative DNA primase/helicase